MTPVEVLPEAKADIRAGRAFFERAWTGLGDEFVDEVLATLDRISDMPLSYGEVDRGIRAGTVKRFGYVAYFRIADAGVEVVAVLHGARDTEEWLRRA